MKYPYCLPVLRSSQEAVVDIIRMHKADYAYFEVWLDYLKECSPVFLKELEREADGKLVIVFRRQNLEPIKMSLEQRYELLDHLNNSEVLIDLDVSSQQDEIAYTQQTSYSLQTIISYHNYEQTPDQRVLDDLVQQIRKNNPTILKIATNCQNRNDSLRLLKLLVSVKEAGQRCIVLGMGESGMITRIFGSIWGNELIFAPEVIEDASAPGQLTRKQLDNILQTIGE